MGIISNDDFEGLLPKSDDLAIEGIATHGAWFYYTEGFFGAKVAILDILWQAWYEYKKHLGLTWGY